MDNIKDSKITLKHADGIKTTLHCFECGVPLKGTVVIYHGMAEHHERYYHFISFLNSNGFDVYTYDHRGHGTDKPLSELGFVDKKNGASILVNDALDVADYVYKHMRPGKLILFGHSMGSMIVRLTAAAFKHADAVIISGTTMPPRASSVAGRLFCSFAALLKGAKHHSYTINKMMFMTKKYTQFNTRTVNDWLTRNAAEVGCYMHDPYCGFLCTTSFYKDLTVLAYRSASKQGFNPEVSDVPIFIISGDCDPVGSCGKEPVKLYKRYLAEGYKNVTSKIYPECRHELLNELNKQDIMNDILAWINKVTA